MGNHVENENEAGCVCVGYIVYGAGSNTFMNGKVIWAEEGKLGVYIALI